MFSLSYKVFATFIPLIFLVSQAFSSVYIVPDDFTTHFGMKCIINFRQIITAKVSIEKASVEPQKTDITNTGPKTATTASQKKSSLLYDMTNK